MSARGDYKVYLFGSDHVHDTYDAMCAEIDRLRAEVADLKDGFEALKDEKFVEIDANMKAAFEEVLIKLGGQGYK